MDLPFEPSIGFASLGISPALLTILTRAGLVTPTPIQAKAIPIALTGSDLMGIAQTGTGKTLAFALPIIEHLLKSNERALVIVPTRELALQVEESLQRITRFCNPVIRTISLIGGAPIYRQIRDLKSRPRIIIATPGRLQDHLNQGTLQINDVTTLVLDEADRMLDMGFAPHIKQIIQALPNKRQTMLFSATMAPEIAKLAAQYLNQPVRVEVSQAGSTTTKIEQELFYVAQQSKVSLLGTLLQEHPGTVLVFSRTKHGANRLSGQLQDMGHTSTEMHSNKSLGQRKQALSGFKTGKFRVLVATDVAARGLDVNDISLVVNFDLPDAAEDYIHRIGRTGRAGKEGKAISFATPDQRGDVRAIERLMKQPLPLAKHSLNQPAPAEYTSGARVRPPYSQQQSSRRNSYNSSYNSGGSNRSKPGRFRVAAR